MKKHAFAIAPLLFNLSMSTAFAFDHSVIMNILPDHTKTILAVTKQIRDLNREIASSRRLPATTENQQVRASLRQTSIDLMFLIIDKQTFIRELHHYQAAPTPTNWATVKTSACSIVTRVETFRLKLRDGGIRLVAPDGHIILADLDDGLLQTARTIHQNVASERIGVLDQAALGQLIEGLGLEANELGRLHTALGEYIGASFM